MSYIWKITFEHMRKNLILTLLLMSPLLFQAGVIVVEGEYQLKNVFVLNGESPSGVGFCVYEVTVNGDITADEINSDAFEIDLSVFGLELGDPVELRISHKDGCEPKVLNPEALEPTPTFEVKALTVSPEGILSWSTVNEQGALPFIVQQFKWNKWVNLGEIQGKGTSNENSYQFKFVAVSGENKLRVIQKSFSGRIRASDAVSFNSDKVAVTYQYDKKKEKITFSDETSFEIYNKYGQVAKRGYGNSVSLTNLRSSIYYLTYDSSMDEIEKK
jgi:hypothetical protein